MGKKKGNPITQQDFSSLFFGEAVLAVTLEKPKSSQATHQASAHT